MLPSAQVVNFQSMSLTKNNPFLDYFHLDDHTRQTKILKVKSSELDDTIHKANSLLYWRYIATRSFLSQLSCLYSLAFARLSLPLPENTAVKRLGNTNDNFETSQQAQQRSWTLLRQNGLLVSLLDPVVSVSEKAEWSDFTSSFSSASLVFCKSVSPWFTMFRSCLLNSSKWLLLVNKISWLILATKISPGTWFCILSLWRFGTFGRKGFD